MKVELTATPDFRFQASNDTGYRFDIGASKSIGGDESGFRPMQLVLAALGSCSGIDAVNILKKSRVEFSRVSVAIEGQRAQGNPAPFTAIHLTFTVHGKDVDRAKAERAFSLGLEKYCSVAEMLKPTVKITHSVEIDADG